MSGVRSALPARPLLARVAESMYWMGRYVERAEHIARIILENNLLLTDVGDLAAGPMQGLWRVLLSAFDLTPPDVPEDAPMGPVISRYMTFDATNANSLLSCITQARENARSIRENISAEMWESLNTHYWALKSEEAQTKFEESPGDLHRQVIVASMLFQGLVDQTLPHGQERLFLEFGKHIERIDMTCRILRGRFELIQAAGDDLDPADRNLQWMSVLRTCSAIETYRRVHPGDLDMISVVGFLILNRDFPRSIRFCVGAAHDAVAAIRASVGVSVGDAAERVLGRLRTQLEYAEASELLSSGLDQTLQEVLDAVARAADAVRRAYFLG